MEDSFNFFLYTVYRNFSIQISDDRTILASLWSIFLTWEYLFDEAFVVLCYRYTYFCNAISLIDDTSYYRCIKFPPFTWTAAFREMVTLPATRRKTLTIQQHRFNSTTNFHSLLLQFNLALTMLYNLWIDLTSWFCISSLFHRMNNDRIITVCLTSIVICNWSIFIIWKYIYSARLPIYTIMWRCYNFE